MRDIIWTIIIVWLIFRLVALFRNNVKRSQPHAASGSADFTSGKPGKDLHSAMRKRMNQEGEYVDFEEVK